VPLQIKSFVVNLAEVGTEDAEQSWGGVTSLRREAWWFGAEIRELVHSEDSSDWNSVRSVTCVPPGM
jgi:hypothetical protein